MSIAFLLFTQGLLQYSKLHGETGFSHALHECPLGKRVKRRLDPKSFVT